VRSEAAGSTHWCCAASGRSLQQHPPHPLVTTRAGPDRSQEPARRGGGGAFQSTPELGGGGGARGLFLLRKEHVGWPKAHGWPCSLGLGPFAPESTSGIARCRSPCFVCPRSRSHKRRLRLFYYFSFSRSCGGCWVRAQPPLLPPRPATLAWIPQSTGRWLCRTRAPPSPKMFGSEAVLLKESMGTALGPGGARPTLVALCRRLRVSRQQLRKTTSWLSKNSTTAADTHPTGSIRPHYVAHLLYSKLNSSRASHHLH
jgi:hypothetical protein